MKIMLTGGAGYVGSRLIQSLEKRNSEYVSIDKEHDESRSSLSFDLQDEQETAKAIQRVRPDLFIHCATYSALSYGNQFIRCFKEDSVVLSNILAALPDSCRLVYFSSSYVYSGEDPRRPVAETIPLRPRHNFGLGKRFFEEFIARNHPNSVVFRLASVFGPGNALHPNAVFSMATECIGRGMLEVWGSGSRMMQYVFVDDVVSYVLDAPSINPGVYNLGGDIYVSTADVASSIARHFGSQIVFREEKKEGETLPFMDISRLKNAAGNHITPFGEALDSYLTYLDETRKPSAAGL